jgi:ribosome assembly protein 1
MEKDEDPEIPGFTMLRCDRSADETGKSRGGGVCAYINSQWCTNVTVREQLCTEHVDLLSVALRPFYLPREFRFS